MRLIKYIINNCYKMQIKIINSNKKLIHNNKFISIRNSIEQNIEHFYYKIVKYFLKKLFTYVYEADYRSGSELQRI